jgi:hypothetical protein
MPHRGLTYPLGLSTRVRVDAGWGDEYRGAMFITHGLVIGVPVIMGAASCREDLAQQEAKLFAVHVRVRIVSTDEGCGTFNRRPLPSGADHNRDDRICP